MQGKFRPHHARLPDSVTIKQAHARCRDSAVRIYHEINHSRLNNSRLNNSRFNRLGFGNNISKPARIVFCFVGSDIIIKRFIGLGIKFLAVDNALTVASFSQYFT